MWSAHVALTQQQLLLLLLFLFKQSGCGVLVSSVALVVVWVC